MYRTTQLGVPPPQQSQAFGERARGHVTAPANEACRQLDAAVHSCCVLCNGSTRDGLSMLVLLASHCACAGLHALSSSTGLLMLGQVQ
mmetsp:Transcript_34808/g.88197  ORF Transcript_34808/g.88197 Transcript_34808/m.88197 type:complete len:88 (-) Transcript_34808:291-554(-)